MLRAAGDADAATRYSRLDLAEPDKNAVLAGRPEDRRAVVVARRDRRVFTGVVDLGARRVLDWRPVPGAESAILDEEIARARRIAEADAGWRAAIKKRGFDSVDEVFCAPLAAGWSAASGERGRRLVRVVCFAGPKSAADVWARPIEGLVAVVDLDARRVIRLVDEAPAPVVPPAPGLASATPPMVERPAAAASFTVAGNAVHWHHWSFRFRLDRREGLILSLLRWHDGATGRLVLYRGSLAEMFVPYMDPDRGWSFRTYMDEGELGLGLLSSPLVPGIDCPAEAAFLDAVLANDRGEPVLGKRVACLFERDTGAPLWRHFEASNGRYAGRPASELVIRTIPSIGDYDYIIDWVLTLSGAVRIEVGATGIDQVKGVPAATMRDPSAAADTRHGGLVADHLVGVDHDHFFSFRLDLDIDGRNDTLLREALVPAAMPERNGRDSLWRMVETPVRFEGPLAGGPTVSWRVVNPNRENALGQHPGYELRLDGSATSLLAPDDVVQRRAQFSAAALWATRYDPGELYAAGPFPNQSKGGDGLPAYAARRRPIENADIVLWCTLGFHHLPGPEDWPVMSTVWHQIALLPAGFFDRNPAFDEPTGGPAK